MKQQDPGAYVHPDGGPTSATTSNTTFSELGLRSELLSALRGRGYEKPTPIQAQSIPHLLQERDLLGIAQTGTGKTAAFALPMLDLLGDHETEPDARRPRALVLTPTRELASQIDESFRAYGKRLPLRSTVVFGGVGQGKQVDALRRGVDVLVATPGRLLDLMTQKHVDLGRVEIFVLDEADRMLDMGFLRDVKRIVTQLPAERQSLLFSATMPADIAKLAKSLLRDPLRVEVTPPSSTVEKIEQRVCFIEKRDKRALLTGILQDERLERVLVFTRTKHGADRVARHLEARGIRASALHGNKSQGQRERALSAFRSGGVRALIATDIAARGLDVRGITHVVNFDLPNMPESYVHRIGRTARAGREGAAISFCDPSERAYLALIEREIRRKLDVVKDTPALRQAGARGAVPDPQVRRPRGPQRRRVRRRRRTYA